MDHELLALSSSWNRSQSDRSTHIPLLSLEEALERSSLKGGISRRDFLADLLKDVQHQRLLPLLAMLPRGWLQEPASLPEHIRGLGILLGEGLISPLLLAAFADDLQHLLPPRTSHKRSALDLWCQRTYKGPDRSQSPLPEGLETWTLQATASLQSQNKQSEPNPRTGLAGLTSLGGEIAWSNHGLSYLQSAASRHQNQQMAQVFNVLGSNLLRGQGLNIETYRFEGQSCGKDLIHWLQAKGWICQARVRTSVASFGLGASTPSADSNQWNQIPLAVPYRTGLQETNQKEINALLPHACLEMELQPPEGETVLLQYYQGTEGLNGWAAMNDLNRPWQNGRSNGTVQYSPTVFRDQQLSDAVDLCELMGAIHNSEANMEKLHLGGYGAIGFCIDSTALLEQALTGSTNLFPLTLGGLWRERLSAQLNHLLNHNMRPNDEAVDRYKGAIEEMPQD
ncbi:MAG: ArgR family transcriptional regulator, partial [Synechococcus sp. ChSW.bin.154]